MWKGSIVSGGMLPDVAHLGCRNRCRRTNRQWKRHICITTTGCAMKERSSAAAGQPAPVKIPKSLHDVDNGKILGFGAELSKDHPGFHDEEYKQRRVGIANIARQHEIGEPIPRIEYTEDEVKTWGIALANLEKLYPDHACKEFNGVFPLFGFKQDEVPQLEDVSGVLANTTGWQIRPVAGLMHPRDFLNGMAFKTFHSTQYMRHPSKPMYTPEPDIVHELLGHVPMLADPAFCKMVHSIGLASLGATDKQIWHLTKVYWYTVEFGVVREGNDIKAFGAGILSSYGELDWMAKGLAKLEEFDPFAKQPSMSYKDGYQTRYFVLNSFQEGAKKLQDYVKSISSVKVNENGAVFN